MRRVLPLLLISVLFVTTANAQTLTHWRKMRHEVTLGFGSTNFLGDLGGADQYGTHFLKDFEISMSRPLFYGGYRYKLNEDFAVKGGLWYGWLRGDDNTTENIYRNSRNLHFRSPILELSAHIEYSVIKEDFGHRYDLRRVRGRGNTPNVYIFTGVSGIYFNPKAKYTDGEWYDLQPMGTEGQNVLETREPYSRIALSIPVGFGLNYMLDRNWGIGFEYGVRYTFTDYIDDVSTTYVDPELLEDEIAKYFADPSDDWEGAAPYNQRGNSNFNDMYMYLTLNVSYKIRPGGRGAPKF